MKKIFSTGLFCLILASGAQLQAQNTFPATGNVGIGTTTPAALWAIVNWLFGITVVCALDLVFKAVSFVFTWQALQTDFHFSVLKQALK